MGEAGRRRGLDAHAAWFAAAAARLDRGRAQRAPGRVPGVRPRRAREHRRRAGLERRARSAARAGDRQRLRLGVDRARRQPRRAAAARRARRRRRRRPARERADALLLAAWIEASSGHLEPARRHVAAAAALADDAELEARCAYYLAYVVSHHGEWEQALELTARAASSTTGSTGPWDQAANALFAARAAISAGDVGAPRAARDEVERWLRAVDDPWLHVRRDAMLGELARVEHRFDDAVGHIGRAAETSGRLGFLQTEAYQLTSLGRAQCQAGDYEAGAATLALGDRQGGGDRRRAAGRARPRPPRPRPARAGPRRRRRARRWRRPPRSTARPAAASRPRSATACSRRSTRRRRGRRAARLEALLETAATATRRSRSSRSTRWAALTGDAARSSARRRMAAPSHFITERDRVDRHAGARRRTPSARR